MNDWMCGAAVTAAGAALRNANMQHAALTKVGCQNTATRRYADDDQTLAEAAAALPEAVWRRPKEAQARLRKWVKRALADLPADALNRLAAMCAMHLDQETLKRTGKLPGYAKAVVDELAAEHVAKVQVARMNGSV